MVMVPPWGAAARSALAQSVASNVMADPFVAIEIATSEASPAFQPASLKAVFTPSSAARRRFNALWKMASPRRLLRIFRTRPDAAFSTSIGFFERRDVELDHLQHRIGDSLRAGRILVAHHLLEHRGNDLPPKPESVDEPSAGLRLAPTLEQRLPVAVELRLVVAQDEHRDR